MSIAENLKKIKSEIAEACLKSGRAADACELIAVTKTKPVNEISEAVNVGQKSFGENYVKEALEKISELPNLEWHFIGTLQSNKAHQVVGKFSLIHSVDRLSLAQVISKEAQKSNIVQDILVQVNVGDEDSKSGSSLKETPELIDKILELKNLRLRGLMALPPLTDDVVESRRFFRILRECMGSTLARLSDSQKSDFKILSMGTTHDFAAAISEGATHVRIGTAIFGARNV